MRTSLIRLGQAAALRGAPAMPPKLRFAIGERVECNCGEWSPGVVVKQNYREPNWPPAKIVPYQIKLDQGGTIFAPADVDRCVRKLTGILALGKIRVTVLTGFLGAGKTTLLNYILNVQHGKRYAVIENEFGDVPIDKMLLDQEAGKRDTVESVSVLDNGCLCCKLRDDLVTAMKEIIKVVEDRFERGVDKAMLDGILIETTGVADPGPIVKTFDLDETIGKYCKVDGILTVVDSKHFLQQLTRDRPKDAVNEPAQQVAFADKLLLNKVDLVDAEHLKKTRAAIRQINHLVPITECKLKTEPELVPIGQLLEIDAFDPAKLLTAESEKKEVESAAAPESHGHGHGHGGHTDCAAECADESHEHSHAHTADCADDCGHSHSHAPAAHHDLDIGSMVLEGGALDGRKFQDFLRMILHERSVDLYRYKGVLALQQAPGVVIRYILQGVHDTPDMVVSGEWPAGVPVKTQIVIIGRKLEKESYKKRFAKCLADA